MRVYNTPIIEAAVMDENLTSAAYNVQQLYGVAIQAVWTGTPAGTFKLQASADPATAYIESQNTPTNWTDIANSSYAVSGAGSYMWNVFDIMYNYIRVVYTDGSSGTSTAVLTVVINAKGP